jgi:hypothetical protein
MSNEPTIEPADERRDDVEDDRVAALERELFERAARANEALAAAQDRIYWLDRWHFDLNAFMRRPVPARLWRLMPAARAVYRGARSGVEALRLARLDQQLAARRRSASASAIEADDLVADALRAAGAPPADEQTILDLGASPPEALPLPHDDSEFDAVLALSAWPQLAPDAPGWLEELRRIVKRGGLLLLAADGETMPARRLLGEATPDWELVQLAPGRVEGNRDLYVLRRRR